MWKIGWSNSQLSGGWPGQFIKLCAQLGPPYPAPGHGYSHVVQVLYSGQFDYYLTALSSTGFAFSFLYIGSGPNAWPFGLPVLPDN